MSDDVVEAACLAPPKRTAGWQPIHDTRLGRFTG
jgi:hypothetical protein